MRPQALLARKLSLYARELAFAARIPASLPQRARFMSQTMAFHWRNWRGITRPSGARLQIPLRLAGKRHTVTVRPGAGDLAVLYEIFTRNAYAVGPEVLDPAGVRAIVDAGAHIGMASLYFADRYLNARILSIEPNPENFALLKANTAGEPRLTLVAARIVEAGFLALHIEGDEKRAAFEAAMGQGAGMGVKKPIRAVIDASPRPVDVFWAP